MFCFCVFVIFPEVSFLPPPSGWGGKGNQIVFDQLLAKNDQIEIGCCAGKNFWTEFVNGQWINIWWFYVPVVLEYVKENRFAVSHPITVRAGVGMWEWRGRECGVG